MLLLADDLVRKESAQGFFEEPAKLEPPELVLGLQLQREIDETIIEQRETNLETCETRGADNLGKIVIGERVLPVKCEHAIDQRLSVAGVVDLPLRANRFRRVDLRKKLRRQHGIEAQPRKQVVRLKAVGHSHLRLPDVPGCCPRNRQVAKARRQQYGLDEALSEPRGNAMVELEEPLCSVASVAAEKLV